MPADLKRQLGGLKRGAKATAKRWIRPVDAYFRTRGPQDIIRFLRRAGVEPGAMMMVHATFDGCRYFRGTAMDALRALHEVIGESGTLVMPALPFKGRTYDYLAGDPVFDVRRTPARTGLLAELLRRTPGTCRSLHPTHSVVATGRQAEWLTADHQRDETPFGKHSPWQRMLDEDAWIVGLGITCPNLPFTQYHHYEELLRDLLPVPLYTSEPFEARAVDRAGTPQVIPTYCHAPGLDRDYAAMNERQRRAGVIRMGRVGAIPVGIGRARALFDTTRRWAEQGWTVFRAPAGTPRRQG